MTSAPHVVMIVPNAISMDSRVQKVAITAEQAGYRVTLLGVEDYYLKGAVLIGDVLAGRLWAPRLLSATRAVRRSGKLAALRSRLAVCEGMMRSRRRAALGVGGFRARLMRLGRLPLRVRVAFLNRSIARMESAAATPPWLTWWHRVVAFLLPGAGWRHTWPYFVDYEDAFAPTIVALEPDLIHVHDVPLLPAAVSASRVLRANGHGTKVIYDAHEWWPGVATPNRLQRVVTTKVEKTYAREVDAVITVGSVIAEWLMDRHHLVKAPTVVENCPSRLVTPEPGRRTLRDELGLPAEVPLFVSSGSTAPRRGIATVIAALPELPTVHLAIVGKNPEAPEVRALLAQAAAHGVADRVHARPYVSQAAITWYLGSADVGLAPFHRTPSHDSALATKISEYLVAGLPVLGSDCTVMAQYLRETGTGEVFVAQDVADCVRAARVLLADLPAYRAAITADIRASRTWERQERALLALYDELVGPPVASASSPDDLILIGQGATMERYRAGVLAYLGDDAKIRVVRPYRGTDAEARTDRVRWARALMLLGEALRARAVVVEGLSPVFGPLMRGDAEAEIGLLIDHGVECHLLLHPSDLEHTAAVERLAARGCGVLASSPDALAGLERAAWLPFVAGDEFERLAPVQDRDRPVVLALTDDGHLPGPLLQLGRESIDLRTHAGWLTPEVLGEVDLVVETRPSAGLSRQIVQALTAGRPVIADLSPDVRERFPTLPVTAAAGRPHLAVQRLIAGGLADHGRRGARYAADSHSAKAAARVLCEAVLGLAADEPQVASADATA